MGKYTTINGCKVEITYSERDRRCRACEYKEYCRVKYWKAQEEQIKARTKRRGTLEEAARTISAAAYSAGMSVEEFNKAYWAAHSNPLNRPVALRGGDWSAANNK